MVKVVEKYAPAWARCTVVGHRLCGLAYGGVPMFFAGSLQSARAFQGYWGGEIICL